MPRVALLREITDSSVLDEVFAHGRVTRAGLADATGISGPTVWESVRRLAAAGLLRPAGSRETAGRGRSATYYELAAAAGWVLAVAVDLAGVRTCVADLAGRVSHEAHHPVPAPDDGGRLVTAVRRAAQRAIDGASGLGKLRAAGISVASPVRPSPRGREVVAVPGSTFPAGTELTEDVLTGIIDVPLLIDNDVNLAALAERRHGSAQQASSFAYAYIGAGLGMAVYIGDHVIRGSHGLAGEIGYLAAPAGNDYVTLSQALADQGFHGGGGSLDVAAVLTLADRAVGGDADARAAVDRLGILIGNAVVAGCAIVDPELVLLGGPIGCHAAFEASLRDAVTRFVPAPPRIAVGSAGDSASLRGALYLALEHGRKQLVDTVGAKL
jgi:predicted NBD/HSP70 family sugar kinase